MSVKSFNFSHFLKNITSSCGVYTMYNTREEVIYVGKAKNLKNRLSSYFRKKQTSSKTEVLVSQINKIDITVTSSEVEALLLEQNLIKKYLPKFNVLLRDDKSYPYIYISNDTYPRISIQRNQKFPKGEYFGPYPNVYAVRENINLIQDIFKVRLCSNNFFSNRKRPCLKYQVGKCSAPCVKGYISDQDYIESINLTKIFLKGNRTDLLNKIVSKMNVYSEQMEFEKAAKCRDQIQNIHKLQAEQIVINTNYKASSIDVFVMEQSQNLTCFQILFYRDNKVMGTQSYFPYVPKKENEFEIISSFIYQFYTNRTEVKEIPSTILLDSHLSAPEINEIKSNLLLLTVKKNLTIKTSFSKEESKLVKFTRLNIFNAIKNKTKSIGFYERNFVAFKSFLEYEKISRIECYDISHLQGKHTVASSVVFGEDGPLKKEYRSYNINNITPGDDYAAMRQLIFKRFNKKLTKDKIPDIILIDGGRGQLNSVFGAFNEINLDIYQNILFIGVAKDISRKDGLETLKFTDRADISLPDDSDALHLIQFIRDESHRFALKNHRRKRQKDISKSILDDIPGVGVKRKTHLLQYIGGLQELKKATLADLNQVPGISSKLAKLIYDYLKPEK